MASARAKPSLKYAHTKDGANLVIPKTAPKLETANLFLNFMTEPENAACYAKYSYAIKERNLSIPRWPALLN